MSIITRCDRCEHEGRYSVGSGVGDWTTIKLWLEGHHVGDQHICHQCSRDLNAWLNDVNRIAVRDRRPDDAR